KSLEVQNQTLRVSHKEALNQLNDLTNKYKQLEQKLKNELTNKDDLNHKVQSTQEKIVLQTTEIVSLQSENIKLKEKIKSLQQALDEERSAAAARAEEENKRVSKITDAEERCRILSESNRLLLIRLKKEEEARK